MFFFYGGMILVVDFGQTYEQQTNCLWWVLVEIPDQNWIDYMSLYYLLLLSIATATGILSVPWNL